MAKIDYAGTIAAGDSTDLVAGSTGIDLTTGSLYISNSTEWIWNGIAGITGIVDVGIPSQRHNRISAAIGNTWPGNDTYAVTWTQADNVRRYRILVLGGAAGDYVKVCEDAVNEAQAEAWLTVPASSVATDVEHLRVYAVPAGTVITQAHWSEWQELSKDPNDLSLSRLDFLASAVGPFTVLVEAE